MPEIQGGTIYAVGSINADLVAYGNPAEAGTNYTVGHDFNFNLGGKSLNVAMTLNALKAQTKLVSRVGSDFLGTEIIRRLEEHQIDSSNIKIDPQAHTGIGHVRISDDGEYDTMVIPGASLNVGIEDFRQSLEDDSDGMVVLNFEISKASVFEIANEARSRGIKVAINFSPIFNWGSEMIALADLAVLNYSEANAIVENREHLDLEGVTRKIQSAGAKSVVITLGKNGVCGCDSDGRYFLIPTNPTEVVNAVGAGDTFLAALIRGLSSGLPLEKSAEIANEAGRLACLQAESFLQPNNADSILKLLNQLIEVSSESEKVYE